MPSEVASVLLTILVGAVPWVLPNLDMHAKIIGSLLLLLICGTFYCFKLQKMLNELEKKCDTTEQRHNALSKEYEERIALISHYRQAIRQISYLLTVAIVSGEKGKLKEIYDAFQSILKAIDDQDG